ncbi:hypothetical protein KKE45_01900, partial [Patescibacteria group bacterium]|nr:hypothetical protein [Patescibacteria group bacterium]
FFLKNTLQIILTLIASIFILILLQNQLFKIKLKTFSLSAGDRYISKLTLWRYYADNNLWNQALNLESTIDPVDIVNQKNSNYPPIIKEKINNLVFKNDKSIDDLIEIAKLYSKLNQYTETRKYLLQAQQQDPIRDDIQSLLVKLNSN